MKEMALTGSRGNSIIKPWNITFAKKLYKSKNSKQKKLKFIK